MPRLTAVAFALMTGIAAHANAQRAHGGHSGGSHISTHAGSAHVRIHDATPRAPTAHAPHISRDRSSARVAVPHTPRIHEPKTPGARDSRGRLERSAKAKDDFMRSTGHAHGWPGHVVDHIVPLGCGGADAPSNMQWQTTAEARAKDKTERKGCGR